MNTKTKMMLGLSVLTAGTLAAGATGTFAWFTTNKSAKATYSNIVAVGTQGDLKASISAVTGSITNVTDGTEASATGGSTYITDVSSNDGFNFVQPDWIGTAGNNQSANSLKDVSEKNGYFTQYLVTLKNISKSASVDADAVEVLLSSLTVTIDNVSTSAGTVASANWIRVAIFSKDSKNVESKAITPSEGTTSYSILNVGSEDLKGVYSNDIVKTTDTVQGNDKYVSAISETKLTISDSSVKAATTLSTPLSLISKLQSTTDEKDTSKTRTIGVSVWLEGTAADNQDNMKGATVKVELGFTSKSVA